MAGAALVALSVVGLAVLATDSDPPARPPPPLPASPAVVGTLVHAAPMPPGPVHPAPLPPAEGPSFDIVRVSPGGSVVMAGHAEPGADVSVLLGGKLFDHALADARGAWVLVPGRKLPPGAAELTLTARSLDGKILAGDAPVVLVVPEAPLALSQPALAPAAPSAQVAAAVPAPAAPLPALALVLPPSGPARLLQGPPPAPGSGKLGLDTVDYDDTGTIRFSGSAPATAPVRVYVDNAPAGDAATDQGGRWTLAPASVVPPGLHRLRVDQLDPAGHVAHRVEIQFQRETPSAIAVAAGQVVVQPGQNLWRLARRAYGTGLRYTVIYLANRDQIRDARLIYAGQVFAVPQASPVADVRAR